MNRRRHLRRVAEALYVRPGYRVENPAVLPAWVWLRPPDEFDAPHKRGELFFESLTEVGLRVEVFPPGVGLKLPIWRPWTFVMCPLPAGDWSGVVDGLADLTCSVIMDCHFPIMNMEAAIGADEQIIEIIDRKDMLLANLAAADVVTVPQPGWAADLAAVNPNVFLLPDFDDAEPEAFGLRLAEIAQASIAVKQARQAARREMGL